MRKKLDNRRAAVTHPVTFQADGGHTVKILITIGFDANGDPKEVFCASFKAGTVLHAIVMDACVLVSRLLQHGDTPAELAASMCQPPSMLGAIAIAVQEMTLELRAPADEGTNHEDTEDTPAT